VTAQYRIMTMHPDGKAGVNIEREKYDLIRSNIIGILQKETEMTFRDLGKSIVRKIGKTFDGSVMWYYTTVKLDLEARGEIVRVAGHGPQKLRLPEKQ
jgi:hypothetical protein